MAEAHMGKLHIQCGEFSSGSLEVLMVSLYKRGSLKRSCMSIKNPGLPEGGIVVRCE